MQQLVLVGVGSNLPDRTGRTPLQICLGAASALAETEGFHLHSISTWYQTAPIPASSQPNYVNGVVRLTTHLKPYHVLKTLNNTEYAAGRTRSVVNAARVLDLDLLAMDDLVLSDPELMLPHPRLAERAFVLFPLCDVAPDWRHPVLGLTARELRERLPPQEIEPIPAEDLPSDTTAIK